MERIYSEMQFMQDTRVSKNSAVRRAYFFFKAVFDRLFSGLVLLFCAPLIALIALAIKLDSRGPVFFLQQRIGARRTSNSASSLVWEQTRFPCFKFRTMVDGADSGLHRAYIQAFIENDQQAMNAIQQCETDVRKLVKDPRITRVGRILRKTSLDELPQFWNVLRGEMSVVGPRPAIPYEVEMYKPWHFQRLEAQPGITGLWQVTARSEVDFDGMVRLDIDYAHSQSLWLDLKIILKTPFVMISRKGAH